MFAPSQAEQAWLFLHVLDLKQWGRENTRSACWCGVRVDWAEETVNMLGSWVGRGVGSQASTCTRILSPGGWTKLQASIPLHLKTGLGRIEMGKQCAPGLRDCGSTRGSEDGDMWEGRLLREYVAGEE